MTQRKITLVLAIFFSSLAIATAQTSDMGFSFQGYAIDPNGKALASTGVTVRFTLSPGTFTEEYVITTDAFGVFHAIVGNSSIIKKGEFAKLDFTKKGTIYTLKVEVKKTVGGIYTIISNEPMKAVPYARYAFNGVPVGSIIAYGGDKNSIPGGWLLCDGTSVAQATYPQLYAIIGSAWGTSGTSFNLPDLRGRFLRGVDLNSAGTASGNDPDAATRTASAAGGAINNNVGTVQGDATKRPNTIFTTSSNGAHTHPYNDMFYSEQGGSVTVTANIGSSSTDYNNGGYQIARTTSSAGVHAHTISGGGDAETRPKNAAVYFIVKY